MDLFPVQPGLNQYRVGRGVRELHIELAGPQGGLAPGRVAVEVVLVGVVLGVVHAGLEAGVEDGGGHLAQPAAQGVHVLPVGDDSGVGEAVLVVDLTEGLLQGEDLAGLDDRAVDELGPAGEVLGARRVPGVVRGGELADHLADAPLVLRRRHRRLGHDHRQGHGPAGGVGGGGAGLEQACGQGRGVNDLALGSGDVLGACTRGTGGGAVDLPGRVLGGGLDLADPGDDAVTQCGRVEGGAQVTALGGDLQHLGGVLR